MDWKRLELLETVHENAVYAKATVDEWARALGEAEREELKAALCRIIDTVDAEFGGGEGQGCGRA
ncbi:MAG: hypothetical protein LBG06_11935 [Deltaproteobacteria bacterium]|nr:hypothetical protein [Deltaproteobacteria bacterium]